MPRGGDDPLCDLTLIGRSFGGMVVKLILDAGGDHIAKIWRAITVATPFYGYGGQLHRFFKGEPYLNWYYGTSRMAQIISSMLGVYTLQFLDYDTYRRDKGLLEKDPDYPCETIRAGMHNPVPLPIPAIRRNRPIHSDIQGQTGSNGRNSNTPGASIAK